MTQAEMLRLGMLIERLLHASLTVFTAQYPRGGRYKPQETYSIPAGDLDHLRDAYLALVGWSERVAPEQPERETA